MLLAVSGIVHATPSCETLEEEIAALRVFRVLKRSPFGLLQLASVPGDGAVAAAAWPTGRASRPITYPTTPAGTSSAKKRSQMPSSRNVLVRSSVELLISAPPAWLAKAVLSSSTGSIRRAGSAAGCRRARLRSRTRRSASLLAVRARSAHGDRRR